MRLTTGYIMQPGYSYANEFEFGLNLVLDGVAALATEASVKVLAQPDRGDQRPGDGTSRTDQHTNQDSRA
jgi:hypothetical protein